MMMSRFDGVMWLGAPIFSVLLIASAILFLPVRLSRRHKIGRASMNLGLN
jgi:hypothetical protein